LLLLSFSASAQTNPTAQNKPVNYEQLTMRLDSLATENKIIKERIQNYASTNDKVLTLVYWISGTVLAFILGLTIWNNVAAYQINNNRIKSIEQKLYKDNAAMIETYLKENLNKKVKSSYSGFEGQIEGLKGKILNIEIELLKRSITVTDMVGSSYVEEHNLVELLEKSLKWYEMTTMEYDLKDTLDAILTYLKKHPNMPNYTRDKFIYAIRKVTDAEFKHYVDEIRDLLKIKE